MAKVRTTISLSEASHRWLRERAPSTGEMAEYLDQLVQRERTLGTLTASLEQQVDRLKRLFDLHERGISLTRSLDPDCLKKAYARGVKQKALMEEFQADPDWRI